jgi:diguanylate cyclase (GGDEF)-like protein/PAS domain S-box-containing protein
MTITESRLKVDSLSDMVSNYSPFFVCIHKNSIILSIDEGGTQLLGYHSPDELIGRSIFSFLDIDEQDMVSSRIDMLEQGASLPSNIMKFSINGVPIDLEVKSETIFHEEHPAIKTILHFLTPLDRDSAKDHQNGSLTLNSNRGIIITRPDGIILSVSESFSRLTGYSRDDVIGNNPRMWKSRSYTPTFYEKMWNSILTKGCWQGDLWNKRKDGSHYLMKVNIYSILNKAGDLTNYIAVYTDLSEVEKLSQQLKESEEQYRTLVELSPNGIILTQSNKIIYANPPAAELFGFNSRKQIIGLDTGTWLKEHHSIKDKLKFDTETEICFEEQLVLNDSVIDIEISSSLIFYQGQKAILTVIKEITERKSMERELRESEEQYRFIAENSSDIIGRLSKSGKIIYISPACKRILGYTTDELIGTNIYDKLHPDDRNRLLEEYGNPKDLNGIATFNYRMKHKKGKFIWAETTVRTFRDSFGNPAEMMFATRDVSARMTIENQLRESNLLLRKLSSLDGLTEIYNRRAFDEFLKTEWSFAAQQSTPISLLLLDIDYFKKYNDTYGHIQGDDCLKNVARNLESFFHEKGHFAARYGGEEFAVVLPNTNHELAYLLAEEFRTKIQSLAIEHNQSNVGGFVTISIGVSSLIPEDDDIKLLLNTADQALYKAKLNGRNRTEIC